MREILFRGKRLDNGEWVEGDLVHSVYKVGDTCVGKLGCTLGMHQVDPSTAGQYTGLKDKNGKRIFEGDILGSRYDDLYPDDVTIEVIKWFRNGWYIQQKAYLPELLVEDGVLPDSEIIGNITDNPELLGEKGSASE